MQIPREFKVNNFDLLRFLAATEVIVDHYFQHLNIPISKTELEILYLFPGVPVFFVISGYLISASYERNAHFIDYVKNRALRIFPGLWGCIIFTVVILSLTGLSFLNKEVIAWLPTQFAGLIYTPGFLSGYGFGSYNGSLWTIPVELQFYMLLPLLYLTILKNKSNYKLYLCFALFVVLHIFSFGFANNHLFNKALWYTFIPYFYLFLLGVIFQRLRLYNANFIYNKAVYWVAGYVLFTFVFVDIIPEIFYNVIKNSILGFVVLSLAYTLPNIAKKILKNNDISYGVYIYHGLLLTVIVQEKLQPQINIYMVIALTYLLAYLSWIFIEKPFIRSKIHTIRAIT